MGELLPARVLYFDGDFARFALVERAVVIARFDRIIDRGIDEPEGALEVKVLRGLVERRRRGGSRLRPDAEPALRETFFECDEMVGADRDCDDRVPDRIALYE